MIDYVVIRLIISGAVIVFVSITALLVAGVFQLVMTGGIGGLILAFLFIGMYITVVGLLSFGIRQELQRDD